VGRSSPTDLARSITEAASVRVLGFVLKARVYYKHLTVICNSFALRFGKHLMKIQRVLSEIQRCTVTVRNAVSQTIGNCTGGAIFPLAAQYKAAELNFTEH
jgi:hypothetical protein